MAKAKEQLPAGVPPEGGNRGGDDEKPKPKFGTGKPAEAKGVLPRVIDQLERAVAGTTRFKIRCNNYGPKKTRYVLAADGDEKGARECYLKAEGLDKELDRLEKLTPGKVEPADLVVTELPD
jgi:hypothetical protein